MPVHQSYPSDAALFIRQPSLLRLIGEAIISLADRYEAARAERRRRHLPHDLPSYLRKDLGLPPLDIWPSHWDRW